MDILVQMRSSTDKRNDAITYLLNDEKLTSQIKKFVLHNNGTNSDYHTVLSDTMIVLVKQVVKDATFTPNTNLEAYLMGVAKYIWYGYLRKQKKELIHSNGQLLLENMSDELNVEELTIHTERGQILNKILMHMGKTCRDILTYWSMKYRMDEIAKLVGIESEGYLRKKKHECVKTLKSLVESNPHLKEQLL